MTIFKRLLAFVLVFCVTAATVAVAAYAANLKADDPVDPDMIMEDASRSYRNNAGNSALGENRRSNEAPVVSGAAAYSPRLSAPSYSNAYYYSDKNVFYKYGWGMPNCTCYAWGRAYEILGKEPNLSVYSAYLWYDYNKQNGYYAYGQTPKLGAVACWVYTSGTSGHVAVVEKIENGTITFSNSAWGGEEFYTSTAPVSDPSNGRSGWIFQGYIYIGEYENNTTQETQTQSAQGDVYRITSDTGVNFRSGPGTSYSTIGAIAYGVDLVVTKTERAEGYTWGYTNYNGMNGWFVTDFSKLIYKKTSPSTGQADKPRQRYLMGDTDGDGYLSVIDATHIQKVLAKYYTPTEYVYTVGDYDGDSVLSVLDAVSIQKTLAGV